MSVNYSAKFCNNISSTVPVDEIRIYKNGQFEDFECKTKEGWELVFIHPRNACWYVATSPVYYIKPGKCEIFEFKARAPESGCEMVWEFESIDVNQFILFVFDTTSTENC